MAESKTIPAVHKAVNVIQYIADATEAVTVKELAYSLSIPPASCYRLVRTLLEHNWLREEPTGGLRIAFGLAHAARAYSELETRLREFEVPLQRLAAELKMSAKITIREGFDAVTALRAEPPRPNAITSPIGYRFHLAIGSAASVLLAQLQDDEIKDIIARAPQSVWERQSPKKVWQRIQDCRQTGACADLGLTHPSIYAVSVPLRLTETNAVALTAVGWPDDFSQQTKEAITQRLKNAESTVSA